MFSYGSLRAYFPVQFHRFAEEGVGSWHLGSLNVQMIRSDACCTLLTHWRISVITSPFSKSGCFIVCSIHMTLGIHFLLSLVDEMRPRILKFLDTHYEHHGILRKKMIWQQSVHLISWYCPPHFLPLIETDWPWFELQGTPNILDI